MSALSLPVQSTALLCPCRLHWFAHACVLVMSMVAVASGADMDLREPIVRPDPEMVKRWLHNFEIVVAKRSLWFDRKEKIEPSKISKVAAQGGSVFQKPSPLANYATSVWRFDYPDGKEKLNSYTVVIEYEWAMKLLGGIERKFVKAIVTGP